MKKYLSLLSAIMLLFIVALSSCNTDGSNDKLSIGYMAGPTGMGMAQLIESNGGVGGNEKYAFTNYQNNTTLAMADLVSGAVDAVCVPTNLAANFYNKNNTIVVLAINCLNSLYLVTDEDNTVSSISELNGKTIYTCKNGTPKPILEYVLRENGINATVSTSFNGTEIAEPKDVGALVAAGKLPIAVMPEPIITSTLLSIQKNEESVNYTVDLDLGEFWDNVSDTPVTMGCIVARADFVNNNKKLINNFLEEYKASISYVSNVDNLDSASDYIVNSQIMQAKQPAKIALGNLGDSIAYLDGSTMKNALIKFYDAVGITKPDDDFYYEK